VLVLVGVVAVSLKPARAAQASLQANSGRR
jgi:hypothetical protein